MTLEETKNRLPFWSDEEDVPSSPFHTLYPEKAWV
jgi:hypothetical protein